MNTKKNQSIIDEYIASFPGDIQVKLKELREIIRKAAPEAEEKISYGMPTFYTSRNLVHFAAHSKHIGFYPGASGAVAFRKESDSYKSSKGSIQLPLDKPLPKKIITKVVKFRVKENLELKKLGKKS